MPISGKEMLAKFIKAGWKKIGQRGSHMKVGKDKLRQTIPMHKELKKGLEQKLLKFLEENK